MNGYPKHINTKQDILNLLADAAYKEQALAYVQKLLDERYGWIKGAVLADGDAGDTSTGHMVVPLSDTDGTTTPYQYDWGYIGDSYVLSRLGITVSEAVGWGCVDRAIAAPTE